MDEPEEIPIKVLLCGAVGCGKTSLTQRWTKQYFSANYTATIGMSIDVHNVKSAHHTYHLQIWDTSGQERFHKAMPGWMKDVHVFCFCYNINSRDSWNAIPIWLAQAKWAPLEKDNPQSWGCHDNRNALGFLVGLQTDRVTYREVNAEESSQPFAEEHNLQAFETSALTGEGIGELEQAIVAALEKRYPAISAQKRLSNGPAEPVDTPLLEVDGAVKRKHKLCRCCW